MNGIQYQPSYFFKDRRKPSVIHRKQIPLVVPGVQATEHETEALDHRLQTRAVGDHVQHVETDLPEWLQQFTEGLTRGSSSSTDVSPADVELPPPPLPPSAHPPATPPSNRTWRNNNLFCHFPQDPNCEVWRRTKVTRTPCKWTPDG